MGEAYEQVAGCDKPARVVYVLTDLARSAWDVGHQAEGLDKVEKIKSGPRGRLVTFVLRLTPEEIRNVSVDTAEPPDSAAAQGEPIEIRSRIHADPQGKAAVTRTVEFFVDGVKRAEKSVRIRARRAGRGRFPHAGEPQGGRAAPRRDRPGRRARPLRGRRQALLHAPGPPAAEGPRGRRPPSRRPGRWLLRRLGPRPGRRRRRAPGRSWSNGTRRRNSRRATRACCRPTRASSCSTSQRSTTRPGAA